MIRLNWNSKVLVGDLESSLFTIPSKELVCSNSGQLLRNMQFYELNCPLEQEYPDQVSFTHISSSTGKLCIVNPRIVNSSTVSAQSIGFTRR